MKLIYSLFVTLILIQQWFCGHIYIEDLTIEWQNLKYFTKIILPFNLENYLEKDEVIKIQLPIDMTSVTSKITVGSSTTNYVGNTYQESGTSNSNFLITMNQRLPNNVWAVLELYGTPSTVWNYKSDPVMMETFGGLTGTATVGYSLLYDYNYDCGFIMIGPNPAEMQYFSVSTGEDIEKMPSLTNGELEETYKIYVDIQTQFDYLNGGIFQLESLNNDFKFSGACESIAHDCSNQTDYCKTISKISNYNCSLISKKIVFTQNEEIKNNQMIRLQIEVQNPDLPNLNDNGLKIILYSKEAKYVYEEKSITSVFQTSKIPINQPTIQFFWGLNNNKALNRGCPITIYKSRNGGRMIYNKVKISVSVNSTFPNTISYKAIMKIQGADYVNDISIVTDLPAYQSGKILCEATLDDSNEYITCSNLGSLTKDTSYYIGFAFVSHQYKADLSTSKDLASFTNFGRIKFQTSNSVDVTYESDSISYTDSAVPRLNEDYTNGLTPTNTHNFNQVWDIEYTTSWVTPTSSQIQKIATGSNTDNTGRNSIKYISNTNYFDLLMFISAQRAQKCSTTYSWCRTTSSQSHIMLKIITNYNAFSSFSEPDQQSAANNLYKGIEIIKTGVGFMTNVKFIYNLAAQNLYKTISCDQFNSTFLEEEGGSNPFCQTYSYYYTYAEILDPNNDKIINYYNQWQIMGGSNGESYYYELQWACTANRNYYYQTGQTQNSAGQRSICATEDLYDPADGKYPSILLKKLKWSSDFKGNPLYPTQVDLDFIVCWRYDQKSNVSPYNVSKFTLEQQGELTSSGVINAQLINWEEGDSTVIRYGFMNYYKSTGADENYLPMILRSSFYLDSILFQLVDNLIRKILK